MANSKLTEIEKKKAENVVFLKAFTKEIFRCLFYCFVHRYVRLFSEIIITPGYLVNFETFFTVNLIL